MIRESTAALLRRTVLQRQRSGRVPGVLAAVVRGGEVVWDCGVGTVALGQDRAPTRDDQFLIASNTKTFVAVMVMQLRDEGRLSLEDRIGDHLPGLGHDLTVREALSHVTGMQREPLGDVWVTLDHPDAETLLREAGDAERVLPPGEAFHYSNLVYALLGQVVAGLDGRPWEESLRVRLLEPLGLTRTTVSFDGGPRVQGYFVSPWHDVPEPEPVVDLRGTAPAGSLASTATDLARWSHFVARPDPAVLDPERVVEMTRPRAVVDPQGWQEAMGLGLFLRRTPGGRVLVGHTGGMPGHVSGVFTDRESGVGAVVLMSSSTSPDPAAFAADLVDLVLDRDPPEEEPWRPGTHVPEELVPLLGRWYSEGSPWDLLVRAGRLEARSPAWPAARPSWTFEALDADTLRTTSGGERGELLRVVRDGSGAVRALRWATYAMTRDPLPFGR